MRKKRKIKTCKKIKTNEINKNKITQRHLKECLNYNSKTGIFTWAKRPESHFETTGSWKNWNKRFANKVAGSKNCGYIIIRIKNVDFKAHRLAWLYTYGYLPENQIDHKDRVKHHN